MELLLGCVNSLHIRGIYYVNNRLRVWEIAPPVGANARLATQVPDLKFDVFVRDSLDVEADSCAEP